MFLYLLIILVGVFIKEEPYNKFAFNRIFNSFYLQYDLFYFDKSLLISYIICKRLSNFLFL